MGRSFVMEIYKDKSANDFTQSLADPNSRMQAGSAAAASGAYCAALVQKVAEKIVLNAENGERVEYIRRHADILRREMIRLIDEDVKGRSALRRALKTAGEEEIEEGLQASSVINKQVIQYMFDFLRLLEEMAAYIDPNYLHQVKQAAIFGLSAARVCQEEDIAISYKSIDETFSDALTIEDKRKMDEMMEIYSRIMNFDF